MQFEQDSTSNSEIGQITEFNSEAPLIQNYIKQALEKG